MPFYPSNCLKNEKFKKKCLHNCTKNHDHMLYCPWDMARDRCNCYFSFWAIFCPLTPLTAQKIKISKKRKKHLEISSFNTSAPKIMIICYTDPEIWCVTHEIVFFILDIFCPFTTLTAQKIKISQKWKKHLEISSCYTCVPKIMIRWCMVPEIWCATKTDDGWTEKAT